MWIEQTRKISIDNKEYSLIDIDNNNPRVLLLKLHLENRLDADILLDIYKKIDPVYIKYNNRTEKFALHTISVKNEVHDNLIVNVKALKVKEIFISKSKTIKTGIK